MIPYGRQDVTQSDINAVVTVLQSEYLTQGPVVPRFELAVAKHCGAAHALAVNSATSALHIACLAIGLRPGDWLWTSPITFLASANCALYCGANVDFVDIDPRTYNLSPAMLERKLIAAQREGRLPKVVIPVHLCGQSCEMKLIHELGKRFGFSIIEDASHAIGGNYRNEPVGNCRYSDITIFSFHPVKIITTAEGGMALTNNADLARKMALFRSHGMTRDPGQMVHPTEGPWYYQQLELGYNYRMTELHAALGLSQLDRLESYVSRRHQLARRYDRLLTKLLVTVPWQHPDTYSGLHLYVIQLQAQQQGVSRSSVFASMREQGVGVNVHYIPVHTQPYYQDMGFRLGDFPEAERYYAQAISLPMYSALTDDEQDTVVDALQRALAT